MYVSSCFYSLYCGELYATSAVADPGGRRFFIFFLLGGGGGGGFSPRRSVW